MVLLNPIPQIEQLSTWGFKPLPVKPGEKHPYIKWTQYRDKPSWPALKPEFRSGIGVWSPLGSITGWLCLDTDNAEALKLWTERIGELLAVTACVKTRKGYHFYFTLQRGQEWRGWTWESDLEAIKRDAHYEVLGDGQGVMLPPSQHAEDRSFTYHWMRKPDCAVSAPGELAAPPKAGASISSTLAHLLARPPDEGGRDVWLAKVAGHYAGWIPHEDAFVATLHAVNGLLPEPLQPEEVDKKVGIWYKEQTKPMHDHEPESGWLVGTGTTIMTEVKTKSGDAGFRFSPEEWADFDLRVKGVIDDGKKRVYVVDFHHKSGRTREGIRVEPSLFGRSADLTTWLAAQGGSIIQPFNDAHQVSEGRRMLRYLDAQNAPAYITVNHLGWTDKVGFVTHEGVATPDGFKPHEGVCPDPKLLDWVSYKYGQEITPTKAVEVFKEILEFQDETVTSVFAAWWVMALLKGQYTTSLFPFMALEAPSESGKTRGFFAMMVALSGNAQGHGQQTAAAVRDSTAGHRNGLVWLDDLTDVTDTVDLIRQATSEGSRSKKGGDRTSTETVHLLCPILVSGEGLGSVMSEKAMVDRAVRLKVSSPIGRRSKVNPDRPQWDDVLELYSRFNGDLTQIAGSLLVAVLGAATPLGQLGELRKSSARQDDKLSLLRTGARVLAQLTSDDRHIKRVDDWCADTVDDGAINLAIREIVPWALRTHGIPGSARGRRPAFCDSRDGTVWVQVATLADQWAERKTLSARQRQLGQAGAIQAEFSALNVPEGKNKDATGDDGERKVWKYRPLPQTLSLYVMRAATDQAGDDVPE